MRNTLLSQHQRETFATKGLIRLEKFLPSDTVRTVQEFIQRLARKEGAWRDGKWQLNAMSKRPEFTKPISKAEFNTLTTPELLAAINVLVDGKKVRREEKPSLLFTLPQNSPWTIPTSWHIDAPRQRHAGLPGVQMFTFLDTVHPRGGGTLVVTGSHRFVNDGTFLRSKDVKTRLKEYSYFQALMSKDLPDSERYLTESGKVDDVDLQVVELYGEPCDVFLMDLRLLHTLSTNTTSTPRLMVTQRYFLESTKH